MITTFGTLQENGIVTDKIEVDLEQVPSEDPLAFMFGVSSGRRDNNKLIANKNHRINHGSLHSELSQEYLRGFLYGFRGILIPEKTKIRKGQETTFALSHLKINK